MPVFAADPATTTRAHRNLVCATFTEAAWRALTRLPALVTLPGGVFAEIDAVIRLLATRRMFTVAGAGREGRLVRFRGRGGFGAFQIEAAGRIVCRLERHLSGANSLDLINRVLPAALAGTLLMEPGPAGEKDCETYRLIGTTMAAA